MRVHVVESGNAALDENSCVVVPVFDEGEPTFGSVATESDREQLRALAARGAIKAKAQSTYYFPTPGSAYAGVLALGMGKLDDFEAEIARRAAGKACSILSAQRITHVVLDGTASEALPVEAFIEGLMLGQYDFVEYKKAPDEPRVVVDEMTIAMSAGEDLEPIREGCARTVITTRCTNWARDLGNTPPNDLTPTRLAEHAETIAAEAGLTCTVFDEDALAKQGMRAILAVGQGSAEPSRLIVLEYRHEKAEHTLAIVGKGVTFDTGGISLKPTTDMHEMKYDMCGAAAVLGAMRAIGELKPRINVVGVVPAAENKPGPEAYLPGDIVTMYSGKTVEIASTDAEGRMLLADALAYTEKEFKPDAMVDLATLTGACIVALGHYAAALFASDPGLQQDLQLAADASGERVWPLPMWDDYAKLMEGTHADLWNGGPRGVAGSITAACFLKEFVEHTPWAHIDIAGTAWDVDKIPYLGSDATGYGVRLLTQWILDEEAPA